jgi:hypothetical protein
MSWGMKSERQMRSLLAGELGSSMRGRGQWRSTSTTTPSPELGSVIERLISTLFSSQMTQCEFPAESLIRQSYCMRISHELEKDVPLTLRWISPASLALP